MAGRSESQCPRVGELECERVQWTRQSQTDGFDERLLERPQFGKAAVALTVGAVIEQTGFGLGEVAPRNVVHVTMVGHAFDVDARTLF